MYIKFQLIEMSGLIRPVKNTKEVVWYHRKNIKKEECENQT